MENSGRSSVRRRSIAPQCWPRDVAARHPEADPEGQVDLEARSGSDQAAPVGRALGEDREAQVVRADRASGQAIDRRAA